jgi:GNAT superfamily N-acetyltransferase
MEIQKADPSGIEDIVSLNQLLRVEVQEFEGHTYGFVEREVENGNYFVAKEDNQILGAACILDRGDKMHLETLSVHQDHQGKGIGTKLIEHAKKVAVERGFNKLFVDTYCEYSADDFYRKCGFRQRPTFAKYKGKPYHVFTVDL